MSKTFEIFLKGDGQTREYFVRHAESAPQVVAKADEEAAPRVAEVIRKHASMMGLSQRYQNSIRSDGPKVFTHDPRAKRYEFGFDGEDSLGRVYHDPSHPHWRTGIVDAGAVHRETMRERIRRWLR
jgi:hypothetical protein